MSEEDEHRRRRERNNESVRKCRENEKKRVEKAKSDLVRHKQDHKDLQDKYSSLRRELEVLKSLFHSSSSSPASSSAMATIQSNGTSVASTSAASGSAAGPSTENSSTIQTSSTNVTVSNTEHEDGTSNKAATSSSRRKYIRKN